MKKNIFLYLLNEKMEFIPSGEIKCPKSGILLIKTGKVILQVSIAVFRALWKKIFSLLEKIGPYAWVYSR